MKIAVIGYGKMGKTIEEMALEQGHQIVLRINEFATVGALTSSQAEVAIEFSTPTAAARNIYSCFDARLPVVVGTTGWYSQFPEIASKARTEGHALFYATNFSIGVNLFFEANRYLSRLMNRFEMYTPHIEEIHHEEKLDAPSGTAITLAEDMIYQLDRKDSWVLGDNFKDNELPIRAVREGMVPGTHSISYDSNIDCITIKHEAKNRKGFAQGALTAAKWLKGKTGVYSMKDLLKIQP